MSWQTLMIVGLLFGVGYGFLFQKGDFCFVSAFRDYYGYRNTRVLRGIIAALGVILVGWALLLQTGAVSVSRLWVPAAGWTSLVGGLLFGVGAYVAGSCASGCLYRAGMGYVHFWVVFAAMGAGYLVFAYLYEPYLFPILERMTVLPPTSLYTVIPLPALVTALLLVAAALLWAVWRLGWRAVATHVRETLAFFRQSPRTLLKAKSWDIRAVGLLLGLLVVLQFAVWSTLGITTPGTRIAAIAAGWVAGEPAILANPYLGPLFDDYGGVGLGPAELLIIGMVAGAAIAAVLGRSWRLRKPRWERLPNAIVGGLLMGVASRVAPGCNVANILSGLPALSVHSILTAAGIAGGVWAAHAFAQWRLNRAIHLAETQAR